MNSLSCHFDHEGSLINLVIINMANFKSLSYVIQLEAAGVSRQQAQVHAQMLQQVYDEEHSQYATKADLQCLSNFLENKISSEIADVKALINECKQDFAECKKDFAECKKDFAECKQDIAECKRGFAELRADIASIKISHKYLIWIGGGIATMCASAIGMCVSMFLYSLK